MLLTLGVMIYTLTNFDRIYRTFYFNLRAKFDVRCADAIALTLDTMKHDEASICIILLTLNVILMCKTFATCSV